MPSKIATTPQIGSEFIKTQKLHSQELGYWFIVFVI
jgi:hypothetical protein